MDTSQKTLLISPAPCFVQSVRVICKPLKCGVYALVSFGVAERRREIGIRLALGATPGSVIHLIVKEGMVSAAAGCAAGLVIALSFTWTLKGFLYGVTPTDPESFLGVGALLLIVAALACYIPARRAKRIDPVNALRCE